MTAEIKQLEGLGKLLKAAGVKPAGAEQMIREHIDSLQDEARQQHGDIVEGVSALKDELIELRHNHSRSLSEFRIMADLTRREVEASSQSFRQMLRWAKAAFFLVVVLQIAIIAILFATSARNLIRFPEFAPAPNATQARVETAARPSAVPPALIPIKR